MEFDGPGYRVQLPEGVTGTTEAKVDFDITTFKKADGSVLLRSHVGLHPDFNEETSRQERINGMPARSWMRTDAGKRTCVDVLITMRGSESGGPFVHFWYCLESDVDVRQAESIIRSIRAEP